MSWCLIEPASTVNQEHASHVVRQYLTCLTEAEMLSNFYNFLQSMSSPSGYLYCYEVQPQCLSAEPEENPF